MLNTVQDEVGTGNGRASGTFHTVDDVHHPLEAFWYWLIGAREEAGIRENQALVESLSLPRIEGNLQQLLDKRGL